MKNKTKRIKRSCETHGCADVHPTSVDTHCGRVVSGRGCPLAPPPPHTHSSEPWPWPWPPKVVGGGRGGTPRPFGGRRSSQTLYSIGFGAFCGSGIYEQVPPPLVKVTPQQTTPAYLANPGRPRIPYLNSHSVRKFGGG